MSYAWQQNSEQDGAARLPEGKMQRVTITKIVYGNANGAYESADGDPQIMVVMADDQAREGTMFFTLSEKAGWALAKTLAALDPPANLKRMEEDGITPAHFANEQFANPQLVGRSLFVDVKYKRGSDYPELTPVRSATAQQQPAATTSAPPSQAAPPAPSAPSAPPATPGNPGGPNVTTKDQAWSFYLAEIEDNEKRGKAWIESVKAIGKPEAAFTAEDWQRVADGAHIPF